MLNTTSKLVNIMQEGLHRKEKRLNGKRSEKRKVMCWDNVEYGNLSEGEKEGRVGTLLFIGR